ncbi:PQQ-binding-like beta-propeller repeat protein [Streptomyces sp. MN03-5084-2B]|nr:PQQ-binding-like beta-propeller repeat protein [Streptomyces sp. MN03-5084-2B]
MRRPSLSALAVVIGLGLVIGIGVVLHVRGWSALVSEASGRCGSRSRECPQGLSAVLLLAFACTLVPCFASVAFVSRFTKRADVPWPRPVRRGGAIAAVAGLLAGIWPGVLVYDGLRGQFLEVRWSAPPDRPADVRMVGNWVHDDLVVRVRPDRLTAYTARGIAWTTEVPGRNAVCAMSRDAVNGIGLVAWAVDGRPCATVVALDLRTGQPRWQRTRATAEPFAAEVTGGLAIAGDVVVFTEPTGVRAVGRENDDRWSLDAGAGCRPVGAAADTGQVTVVIGCADGSRHVVTVDPGTGRERWRAALPVEPPAETVLLAARPVVVYAAEYGSRGADVFLSFGDDGRVRARIPRSGEDYELPRGTDRNSGMASPVVRDGRLLAPVGVPGDYRRTAVAAFSLETGARLWRTEVDDDVGAVEPTAGGLLVGSKDLRIRELSPSDGRVTASLPVRGTRYVSSMDIRKPDGGYAIVAVDGVAYPPVVMVG